MKKLIFLVLMVTFVLTGCLSLTTTEKLAISPLYQVNTTIYKDIRGDFTIDSLLFYKQIDWSSNTVLTIDQWNTVNSVFYTMQIRFIGPDWRFMEEIHIKTDNNLYSLRDKSPNRNVQSDSNVTVQEIVSVILEPIIIDDLKTTTMLKIQYFAGPITIPDEGINAIRNFLAKRNF